MIKCKGVVDFFCVWSTSTTTSSARGLFDGFRDAQSLGPLKSFKLIRPTRLDRLSLVGNQGGAHDVNVNDNNIFVGPGTSASTSVPGHKVRTPIPVPRVGTATAL